MAKKAPKKQKVVKPIKKTSSKKKTNVGLRASRFSPLSSKLGFAKRKKTNKGLLVGLVLLLVAIGGYLIYSSHAAGPPHDVGELKVDEQDQASRINSDRASNGVHGLKYAECLSNMAEDWAKTESNHNINVADVYHKGAWEDIGNKDPAHPAPLPYTDQVVKYCKLPLKIAGGGTANGGVYGASCNVIPNPKVNSCSSTLYAAFHNSQEHHANILNPPFNYVGVGSYRDRDGRLWVAQAFLPCAGCDIGWTLTGRSYYQINGKTNDQINAKPGQRVELFSKIKNSGPDTATFSSYVLTWSIPKGHVATTPNKLDNRPTSSLVKNGVYTFHIPFIVPSNAGKGDKFCHQIFYTNADGKSTGDGKSKPPSCVTVQ